MSVLVYSTRLSLAQAIHPAACSSRTYTQHSLKSDSEREMKRQWWSLTSDAAAGGEAHERR